MNDDEREMLETMWENFMPLMEDVADSLLLLRALNLQLVALEARVNHLEGEAGPTVH